MLGCQGWTLGDEKGRVLTFRRFIAHLVDDSVTLSLAVLLLGILGPVACGHTHAQIREHCLRRAHRVIRVEDIGPPEYRSMVRELYLRCLESNGVPDAPPSPSVK